MVPCGDSCQPSVLFGTFVVSGWARDSSAAIIEERRVHQRMPEGTSRAADRRLGEVGSSALYAAAPREGTPSLSLRVCLSGR